MVFLVFWFFFFLVLFFFEGVVLADKGWIVGLGDGEGGERYSRASTTGGGITPGRRRAERREGGVEL